MHLSIFYKPRGLTCDFSLILWKIILTKSHDENKSHTKKMQQITTYKAAVHGCDF
jgi:hypothetical protein